MPIKKSYIAVLCIALLCACAGPATTQIPPTNTAGPTQTASPTTATATVQPDKEAEAAPAQTFEITSPAFAHEEMIPVQYTCDGDDTSPELAWSVPPPGTKSLVLISDDPDAPMGTWVHWVLFNIPPETTGLPQGTPTDEQLPDGSIQGKNSWPRTGYGGPCPPSGTHRYYFKLYALDTMLSLDASVNKERVTEAMEGHILAEAELMGKYARK